MWLYLLVSRALEVQKKKKMHLGGQKVIEREQAMNFQIMYWARKPSISTPKRITPDEHVFGLMPD